MATTSAKPLNVFLRPLYPFTGDPTIASTTAKMFKSSLFVLSLLPVLAFGNPQYYGPAPGPGSSSSSTSAAPASAPSAPPSTTGQINVDVYPNGQFIFNPSNINATVGTLITFFFPSGAVPHSVTQSTFADPCTPLTGSNGTGFDSGITTGTQFTLNVTDASTPVWFFCKTPLHCGMGMVGSINAPTSGNTFEAYQAAAKAIGSSEVTIQDNGPVTGGVGAVATGAPSTSSSAPASSNTGSSSSSSDATRVVVSSGMGLLAVAAAIAFAA